MENCIQLIINKLFYSLTWQISFFDYFSLVYWSSVCLSQLFLMTQQLGCDGRVIGRSGCLLSLVAGLDTLLSTIPWLGIQHTALCDSHSLTVFILLVKQSSLVQQLLKLFSQLDLLIEPQLLQTSIPTPEVTNQKWVLTMIDQSEVSVDQSEVSINK